MSCTACRGDRVILVYGYPETCASCEPRYQAGTDREAGADRAKYEVGQVLKFVAHDPDELDGSFAADDLLVVKLTNPGGMGIVVQRWSDGLVDMVWPTEVRVVADDEVL